jgi:tRNA(Ile)-lysidine synthase
LVKTLEERVLEAIRHGRLLVPGDRVGVAVSGGADSVALLRLLGAIRGQLGVTLVVVHFDHQLRGEESAADARFTEELARAQALDFVCERADVLGAAARQKWNLEDAARRLRYAFFKRLLTEGRATRVAVAHTADDQAETVLAHLIRGTGLTGVAGIYPSVGAIVRPLLAERRLKLREYLGRLGQTWREDPSNLDEGRLRARIRRRLLPLLERDFSPQATKHLARLAELAREEGAFWDALVENCFRALVARKEDQRSIAVEDLLRPIELRARRPARENDPALPSQTLCALTERLVRRLYEEMRGSRQGLTAAHIQQVMHLASDSSSGHRVELPGGVVVDRVFGDLVFSETPAARRALGPSRVATESAYQHVVVLPERGQTTVAVPELKRRFCLKVIDWSLLERDTTVGSSALDAERLAAPLVLRNWHQGDAYRMRGHRRVRKLKRMFVERQVPRGDRAGWPVLESAGRVAWVRGMPPADEFCAREGTRSGVVIEEERI